MSIILNHVNHIYDGDTEMPVKALDDVSLTINDGEFIGLIGHTGSGKSTLVQHLNGLMNLQVAEFIIMVQTFMKPVII